jgi:imidazolonepropionase-like amidohydrolase
MPNKNGPGFVDAHVHVRDPGALASVAAAGVAAVRDAGTKEGAGLKAGSAGRSGPAIVSAGWALYKKGGYGSFFGVPVDTRREIKDEIRRLKNCGADIIKVMASGMVSLKRPGSVTAGGFSPGELRLIVDDAACLGLGVMAHANGEKAITAAAAAGVRSIEHGFFMTLRALRLMAKAGIYWTPTVGALARAAGAATISKEMKAQVMTLVAHQLEMIGRAREIGVPLALGTDCVLPDPGYRKSYDAELSYFERAGISREDVLRIACEGGSRLLGLKGMISS